MSKVNLTKRAIESFPVPAEKYALYRDSGVKGLGVKVEPTGTRTFFWGRKARGRLAWKTIGEFPAITVEDARAKASEYNSQLAKWKLDDAPGSDPFASRQAPTLAVAVGEYVERHVRRNSKRPDRAAKAVEWQLERYLSDWRERRLNEIRRADLMDLHEEIGKKSIFGANRLLQMLKAAVNKAIEWERFRGPNPAQGVKLFKERPRKRALQLAELPALKAALDSPKTSADLRDFTHLSLFTGCRKGDLLSAEWRNVDLKRAALLIPNPKNEQAYSVALDEGAMRVLKDRLAAAEKLAKETGVAPVFVFPGSGASGHVEDLKKSWAKLLKLAGLTDLRQHDMRRTLGAMMSNTGATLLATSRALGHSNTQTTEKVYSPIADSAVRESVAIATNAMRAAMRKKPKPALPAAPKAKAVRRA